MAVWLPAKSDDANEWVENQTGTALAGSGSQPNEEASESQATTEETPKPEANASE